MRIILLMNSLFTGGAEFSTLSFYGWLIQKGYTVKLVVLKVATPSYDPKQFGFNEVNVLKSTATWKRLAEFNKIVDSFKPAIVHSVLFDANMLGRLTKLRYGGFKHLESLVNEMYAENRYADPQVTPIKLNGYRLLDWLTQMRGVDHYHANGESVSKHYQQKLGISNTRITVIPRGRAANPWVGNADSRARMRAQWNSGNRVVFINVARHEYQKGQDIILESLKMVDASLCNKIQVVFVGREGKLTDSIRQAIRQNRLDDFVLILGHRTDVNELLAAADVFIFPSRFEGLPGALIEAEAAALPIICSDIANNREVANDENALFFSVNDSNALAHHIVEMLNPELRQRLAMQSLQIFKAKFQLEHIHASMETLLKQLADSKR